jgi:hypothetical protein
MTGAQVLDAVELALVEHFGHAPQRASVSFVGVDPIEVLRFAPRAGERAYVSLGMARSPMTSAAAPALEQDGPRAELLMRVHDDANRFGDVWRQLAVLAAAPAVEGLVYRDGASVDLGQPLAPGSRCAGVLAVAATSVPAIDTIEGLVTVFEVLPATGAELGWARAKGTDALRELWAAQRTDLLDLGRGPVALG